ncbi:TetR/AcrR family transcriptional regulator [Tomitella gaofuii]|uniref:TetR/AcrR family transcriptional regulator n=1 Tax=Tomitella gaofuii TaxID=2760083 RepID=UPI0015FDA304|nr:TetR/AcrR family transcriptional regulator [Tomitella gaofuii]
MEAGGFAEDPDVLPAHQRARWGAIVAAAGALLAEGDEAAAAVQIRDVAARAGVALGTLYRYFPSKEQLYAVVLREWSAADAQARSGDAGADAAAAGERLRARLHHSVRRFEAYPAYLRLHYALQQSDDPVVRRILDQFSAQVVDSYREQVPELPPAERDDVVVMASALLVHQLALYSQGRQRIEEVHRLVDRFVEIVFAAAVPAVLDARAAAPRR